MLHQDRPLEDHHLGLTSGDTDQHLLATGLDGDDDLVVDGTPGPGSGGGETVLGVVAATTALLGLPVLLLLGRLGWRRSRLDPGYLDLATLDSDRLVLLDRSFGRGLANDLGALLAK